MDSVSWYICVRYALICSGMSVLLFPSIPCTSSSSSAPTSAPVFILSWLWIWRCQHIWNTFTTAYFSVKHHGRVRKRRNEPQVRVGSTSASYSMFTFCAVNVSRMRFFVILFGFTVWKNNTSDWPKNYFPHRGYQFCGMWHCSITKMASDVLKGRVVFIVTCLRHMKNEFFVIVVLDA